VNKHFSKKTKNVAFLFNKVLEEMIINQQYALSHFIQQNVKGSKIWGESLL